MALIGKGYYMWKVPNCEGGDAYTIAAEAKRAGLSHVMIKVADGIHPYNIDKNNNVDLIPAVAQALRAEGIHVWGWQYIYGQDPLGEARKAIQRVHELGMEGFVVNAEVEFLDPGMGDVARKYMRELRSGLPDTVIALSTYRFPSYHPQFPYSTFLEFCDLNMPQVYWMGASNPDSQLIKSVREYQNIDPVVPIVPTGFAFKSGSYQPSSGEVTRFLQAAQDLNLDAANFWSWDSARKDVPAVWDEIGQYSWPNNARPKDFADYYIEALNSHQPLKLAAMYTPLGVHVNTARTVQGAEAIQAWYTALFTQILPSASFSLTGLTISANARHLTWTATSSAGKVLNGSDSIMLLEDQIAYHFTNFSVEG
ncbi:MAG: nuclear transport factor 2 family protein [Anaerolineae bacterium]|nr:nuclear transport factor 2 family protein [Anaerolineae bacterium]